MKSKRALQNLVDDLVLKIGFQVSDTRVRNTTKSYSVVSYTELYEGCKPSQGKNLKLRFGAHLIQFFLHTTNTSKNNMERIRGDMRYDL